MNDKPNRKDASGPSRYLRQVDDTYVLDSSSGIYKPKTETSSTQLAGTGKKTPFYLHIPHDWLALVISVATLILLGVTVYFARLQWIEMRDATLATKKAATAAETAANVASQALKESGNQFKIDERPYLIKEYIRLAAKPAMNEKLYGEVLWKNTGKTPALRARIQLKIDVLDKEPNTPLEWLNNAKKQKARNEIGSTLGRSSFLSGDNPLGPVDYGKIKTKKSHVYIFGAISYADIFGGTHETFVCARYDPDSVNELYLWPCEGEHANDVK